MSAARKKPGEKGRLTKTKVMPAFERISLPSLLSSADTMARMIVIDPVEIRSSLRRPMWSTMAEPCTRANG